MIDFRKMKIEESITLTNLRKEIWNTTYRNIMEDSMIDDYNFENIIKWMWKILKIVIYFHI